MICRNIIYKQICNSFLCAHRFQEHVDYDFETNNCPEDKMCGHYTQVCILCFSSVFLTGFHSMNMQMWWCVSLLLCRWSGQTAIESAVLLISVTLLRVWVLKRPLFLSVIITLRKCIRITHTEHCLSVLECVLKHSITQPGQLYSIYYVIRCIIIRASYGLIYTLCIWIMYYVSPTMQDISD